MSEEKFVPNHTKYQPDVEKTKKERTEKKIRDYQAIQRTRKMEILEEKELTAKIQSTHDKEMAQLAEKNRKEEEEKIQQKRKDEIAQHRHSLKEKARLENPKTKLARAKQEIASWDVPLPDHYMAYYIKYTNGKFQLESVFDPHVMVMILTDTPTKIFKDGVEIGTRYLIPASRLKMKNAPFPVWSDIDGTEYWTCQCDCGGDKMTYLTGRICSDCVNAKKDHKPCSGIEVFGTLHTV